MCLFPAPLPFPLEKEILDAVTYELSQKVASPVNRRLDKNLENHHAVMMAGSAQRIKTPAHAQTPSTARFYACVSESVVQ